MMPAAPAPSVPPPTPAASAAAAALRCVADSLDRDADRAAHLTSRAWLVVAVARLRALCLRRCADQAEAA